jgi:hypothetical protein
MSISIDRLSERVGGQLQSDGGRNVFVAILDPPVAPMNSPSGLHPLACREQTTRESGRGHLLTSRHRLFGDSECAGDAAVLHTGHTQFDDFSLHVRKFRDKLIETLRFFGPNRDVHWVIVLRRDGILQRGRITNGPEFPRQALSIVNSPAASAESHCVIQFGHWHLTSKQFDDCVVFRVEFDVRILQEANLHFRGVVNRVHVSVLV